MNIEFRLDWDKYIVISVQEEISDLSRFSSAAVYLIRSDGIKYLLAEDILIEILTVFNNVLLKAIKGQPILNKINERLHSIGYLWNNWANNLPVEGIDEQDIYDEYWIWCTKEIGTWLHNLDGETVLFEISPIYKWHFEEPGNKSEFVTFEEFINNFKVILQMKIDIGLVKKWQTICQNYVDELCN